MGTKCVLKFHFFFINVTVGAAHCSLSLFFSLLWMVGAVQAVLGSVRSDPGLSGWERTTPPPHP